MKRSFIRVIGVVSVAAMLGAACGTDEPSVDSGAQPPAATSDTGAAALRSTLNTLLQEHVYLAASATGAALGGRTDEFDAAAAAVDENSVALADAVTSVYGNAGGEQFLALWRSHIGFFVDYTTAVASDDQRKAGKAVADLQGYADDFGAFIESATEGALTKEAVAGLVLDHVLGLKDVVDAQAAGDVAGAYASLREAAGHMHMIADPLASTIVAQFPDSF